MSSREGSALTVPSNFAFSVSSQRGTLRPSSASRAFAIRATCAVFLMENARRLQAEGAPRDQVLASAIWAIVENMARTLWHQVEIPKDAVVLLHHLCYASGLSEPGLAEGTLDQAKQRVDNFAAGFIEAGASGFIPKAYRLEEIEAALRVVLRHRVYLPAELLLAESVSQRSDPEELPREDLAGFVASELSPRQRQVLALAIRGLPAKLIARELAIAEGTVKVHLSMVYRALGARNRTDALYRVLAADAASAVDLP